MKTTDMKNFIRVEDVVFKRTEKDREEVGIIVNEGLGPIIDMHGMVVPAPLWSWRAIGNHVMTVTEDK